MTLSERVAAIERTFSGDHTGLASDLRVIEMQVARAEEKLLRIERDRSSWTRPDLTLRMMERE